MVAAVFNYANWILLFPEFANTVSANQADILLPVTGAYLRNDACGPGTTVAQQTTLLNLIMAHCAQLFYGSSTQPLSPLVGRVNSATEGSVSVGVDFPQNPEDAWYNQTKYGAAFRQATAPYRTMRYVPGNRGRFFGPWGNR